MTQRAYLQEIRDAKRIVIKVGTSTLSHKNGHLNLHRIDLLVRQISDLANKGKEILLVTSGAVGAGLSKMKRTERPQSIPEKQAFAAIGQGILLHIYEKMFSEYNQTVAQVLLTKENSIDYRQYMNTRNALLTLLSLGVIPIINENDVVAIDELKIGDNDTLSAIVSVIVDADLLILLSDIDGLYDKNPHQHADANLIPYIEEITPQIEEMGGGAGTKMGTGGMLTKLKAAKIAISSGVNMIIANGEKQDVLMHIAMGQDIGTIFKARKTHLARRKSWLAFGKQTSGSIIVDSGCADALKNSGASILAAGIVSCLGDFVAGDTVRVLAPNGEEIARGAVNYDSATIQIIKGHQTSEFPQLFSGKIYEEVIHRNNMVLIS